MRETLSILILTRYSNLGASSRLRFFQFLPYLGDAGFSVTSHSFIGGGALSRRYRRGSYTALEIVWCYWSRLNVLLSCNDFDVLWIEKEALPWLPYWVERLLLRNAKYVLDFDDAVFHQYDQHPSPVIRRLFSKKIDYLMAGSAAVVAGNRYLAERAEKAKTEKILVIPTVVDLKKYPRIDRLKIDGGCPRIVWIGTPGTVHYLSRLESALQVLSRNYMFELHVIGASFSSPYFHINCIEWSELTEAQDISFCDIGIMPLPDGLWERGKCGYKLIQYMACGLPVVASPVGANREIVSHGLNGYLADTSAEWVEFLGDLLSSAQRRLNFGAAGRARVEASFSLESASLQVVELLKHAAVRKPNGGK